MLNWLTVAQIWDLFSRVEVNLFVLQELTQCPLWFSLCDLAPLGIDVFAHPWPDLRLYAFLPLEVDSSGLVQSEGVWNLPPVYSPILAVPDIVLRVPFPEHTPCDIPIRKYLLSQLQGYSFK